MKAIVCTKYGTPDVLQLKEVEKPVPKDNEVLIKVHATTVNRTDCATIRAIPFFARLLTGMFKTKKQIPGTEFAGKIEVVGKEVTDWKVGDQVYGYSPKGGACAEYLTVPASILAKKPANLSFQEAAAVPGGASPALLAFRDLAQPEKGHKVLIIGASGGIGIFGVQIAKLYGAEVSGVCGPSNVDMVKEIGADFVIDYTKEDYTKNDKTYDIIFDAIGANTLSKCKKILSDKGSYVSNNFLNSPKHIFQLMTNRFRKKKLKIGVANESADNLNLLREWIENGKIKPVIDTVYPLNQTADAQRHYETGHSKGRVVISID